MMKKILISGGSGLVGTALRLKLVERGYGVHILSRHPKDMEGVKAFSWDISAQTIDPKAFEGVSHIVHLAGAGIADKRWTDERKKVIIDSRVESAKLLLKGVRSAGIDLKTFISASGINYYGSTTNEKIHVETDLPSQDFIGKCCVKWEAAADDFQSIARVVKLRTGVVFSPKGGALERITQPIKLGFGSPLGSGNQYMPYLHIDDLCEMYIRSIEDEKMEGAYNASNGDPITNTELTKAIAKVLHKPLWLPNIPGFVLKMMFGEMASILLGGSRAHVEKVKSTGFEFRYQNLKETLLDVFEE